MIGHLVRRSREQQRREAMLDLDEWMEYQEERIRQNIRRAVPGQEIEYLLPDRSECEVEIKK